MQLEQLYNQLRFNLEQPYDINKLSVRHKNPSPITIEKGGPVTAVHVKALDEEEQRLSTEFSALNLAKLKEAQFLAKRELKKQNSSLLDTVSKNYAKHLSPTRRPPHRPAVSHALRVKVSPTKKLQHLPASGNSPPVRDVPNRKATAHSRKSLHKELSSHKTRGKCVRRPGSKYSNGVLKEKLDEQKQIESMPDLHKMAMQRLLQVQSGDIPSTPVTMGHNTRQLAKPARDDRRKSSPGSAVKFVKPSIRAKAARGVRERIYRQPLAKPLPRTPKLPKYTKGRVLPIHPTSPQYDPDYDYVDPEAHLGGSAYEVQQYQPQRSQELPRADEFLRRVTEARQANEAAEKYAVNPRKMAEDIEMETRQRLEPLIRQAEALSKDMSRNLRRNQHRTTMCSITPQYDGGHDYEDMSADNLLQHPVESQQGTDQQEVKARAVPAVSSGDAQLPSLDLDDAEIESSYSISSDDRVMLQSMLERLDEMQKEHVEIRHRWLAASTKYDDAGLVHLDNSADGDNTEGGAVFNAPHPLLLKKPQGAQAKSHLPSASSSLGFSHSAQRSKVPTQDKQAGYPELNISLPEKKIKSIQGGKELFERYLENNGHTSSTAFDPWTFAKQTADEILDSCITEVSQELLNVGDGIVQKLYSDEFIAAKEHNDSAQDCTPLS